MKQVLKILILLIVCTGCRQSSGKDPFQKRLTLNLQEGNPPSLNPYVGVDLRSRCLFLALYEPLMRSNEAGELEYAAAESVDIDPTHTRYTFHIRDAVWSNGEEVTANHFRDAWIHALTPNTHCIRADLFYAIKNGEKVKKGQLPVEELKISAPDPKTLIVELEQPTPYFLDLTATSFFAPLYNASSDEPTCFNGPFKLGECVPDQKLVLVKNRDYWDADSVDLEEIYFTMVKDPMTAYIMYENGELDLVGDPFSSLPLDLVPHLGEAGRLHAKVISRIFYLLVNTTDFPMNSPSLRKALGLSVDRELLAKHIFFGELPSYSSLPKPLALLEGDAFEPSDVSELFDQALIELNIQREEFPKVVLSYAELSGEKQMAEFLQGAWKEKLGIDVELKGQQWNTHVANLRTRCYQIGTLHLTTIYQDPMFYFDLFKDKESLCNYTGWEHPKFKERLIAANHEVNPLKRRALLKEAELQLYDEMPAIPVFTQNLQYLVKDNVDLVILNLGVYDFKRTKKGE